METARIKHSTTIPALKGDATLFAWYFGVSLLPVSDRLRDGGKRAASPFWGSNRRKKSRVPFYSGAGPKHTRVMSSACEWPAENSRISWRIARPTSPGPPPAWATRLIRR
jgi:hypothetical protein